MIRHSPVLRTVARITIPLVLVLSVYVFFRGHNMPGGGFIAGVLAAVAGAMYLMSFGVGRYAEFAWWRVTVWGVLIAMAEGVVPMMFGYSFMDHTAWDFHLPVLGDIHFPTATFFDLGVYLIVVGTLMTFFVELALERPAGEDA